MYTLLSINWGNALIVTFFGFIVVVLVLALLILVLSLFGKLMAQSTETDGSAQLSVQAASESADGPLTEAENAAVAMAIYQYCFGVHDEEAHVLTIEHHHDPIELWNANKF